MHKEPAIANMNTPAFLLSAPFHLAAEVANNIWMQEMTEDDRRIDRGKALAQFLELYHHLAACSLVYLLPSCPGLQDQSYVTNLGVVLPHRQDNTVVVSNFRSAPRCEEASIGLRFFELMGFSVHRAPEYFEGEGDLKRLHDNVYVGAHGLRSSQNALRWLEQSFDMRVIDFEMTDPYLYHLDCCIMPLSRDALMVCTALASTQALTAIEAEVEVVDVSLDDAYSGITNAVRLNRQLLCASNIDELSETHPDYAYEKGKLETLDRVCAKIGLEPRVFNLSEFQKSGAMLSCLVMHMNHANYPAVHDEGL